MVKRNDFFHCVAYRCNSSSSDFAIPDRKKYSFEKLVYVGPLYSTGVKESPKPIQESIIQSNSYPGREFREQLGCISNTN